MQSEWNPRILPFPQLMLKQLPLLVEDVPLTMIKRYFILPTTVWKAWIPWEMNTRNIPSRRSPKGCSSWEEPEKTLLWMSERRKYDEKPTTRREMKMTTRAHHSDFFRGFFNQNWRMTPVKRMIEPRIICQILTGIHNRPTNIINEAEKSHTAGIKTL